jgi:hypothetical protein
LSEILRQPTLLLLLCKASQGWEVRDLVNGNDVLWSTIWHKINGHRLKQSCERTDAPPLLADSFQEVVSYDLVLFAVAES